MEQTVDRKKTQAWTVHAKSAATQQLDFSLDDKAPKASRSKSLWATCVMAFKTRRICVHPSQDDELGITVPAIGTGPRKSVARRRVSSQLPPISEAKDSMGLASSILPVYSSTRSSSQGSLQGQSPDLCYHEDLPRNSRVTPRQVQKTIEADLACKHRVTPQQLEKTMKELSDNISFFDDDNFSFVRFLQSAPRNKGQVNHMEMREGNFVRAVVEKRMPRSWMLRSHDEFRRRCPLSVEQPWVDIAIVKELNRHRYQYACDFLGIFEGNEKLHVITSFADQGDLFGWIDTNLRQLGPSRESRIKPIAAQLCDAACWLHQLGIAHRDISLENVVLCTTKDNLGLKLIDFGMAVAARYSEGASYGKGPYKAPEMHTHTVYDAFLTDTFATGVVLLSMVMAAYPWENTTPDGDPKFTKAMVMGMPNCLQSMKTRLPGGAVSSLSQVASNEMLELLAGLLALQPCRRHTLGESCRRMRFSVWDGPWLRGLRPNHGFGFAESDATSPSLPIS